jgi:hypothetical protein
MKTFKQLRESVRAANPEADALKPRAKGEQDFYNQHTKTVTDYPVSGEGGTTTKSAHQPMNADRGPIEQGTSKLADKSGFKGSKTPLTRADKTQGDLKPVRLSPSAVKESVFEDATFAISESEGNSIYIGFMNADSAIINEDTYHAIQDVFEQLSPDNQQIFHTAVNESAESFERILNFVVATYEEE